MSLKVFKGLMFVRNQYSIVQGIIAICGSYDDGLVLVSGGRIRIAFIWSDYKVLCKYEVGANAGETMVIDIDAINVSTLGIGSVSVVDHEMASISLGSLDGANDKVSALRSKLGAVQNRLDFTITNLTNYSENLQNTESNIRDTDMATEMVEYSKTNILQQVAQAMLSHANQDKQGVLQLLQM